MFASAFVLSLLASTTRQVEELPAVAPLVEADAPVRPDKAEPVEVEAEVSTHNGMALRLDTALEIGPAPAWPMASMRIDLGYQHRLGDDLAVSAGARLGYGYRAGIGQMVDASLGVDDSGYFALHQVPMQLLLGLQWGRAPAAEAWGFSAEMYGGAGANLVYGQAHSFGRDGDVFEIAPAALAGLRFNLHQGPGMSYGVFGEYDAWALTSGAQPGLAQDQSSARVGVDVAFVF